MLELVTPKSVPGMADNLQSTYHRANGEPSPVYAKGVLPLSKKVIFAWNLDIVVDAKTVYDLEVTKVLPQFPWRGTTEAVFTQITGEDTGQTTRVVFSGYSLRSITCHPPVTEERAVLERITSLNAILGDYVTTTGPAFLQDGE